MEPAASKVHVIAVTPPTPGLPYITGQANAGWRYVRMFPEFASLHRWVAFYPSQLPCYVGDERVRPQPGGYYGGWVTDSLAGPIKGEPGSGHW